MTVTINQEQRLFVIKSGSGYSCFGFDNCFRNAVQMAEKMNALTSVNGGVRYLAPTEDMLGTLTCYEAYQQLIAAFANHPASKATWFTPGTPRKVQSILERAYKDESGSILRIFTGDTQTGRDWCNEYDVIGHIGRSNGSTKVPLLIERLYSPSRGYSKAHGGAAILTDCILRIIDVESCVELYRAANYQMPEFDIEIDHGDKKLPFKVKRDKATQAAYATQEAAGEYIAFMQGFRVSRPYRTQAEYNAEMQEAA